MNPLRMGEIIAGLAMIVLGLRLPRTGASGGLTNFVLRGWGLRRRVDPGSDFFRARNLARGAFYVVFGALVLLIGLGLA